ncbi:CDP-alcohol phosphatidyltransferase family protein [Microbacterium sp. NPDC056569]|uniref:CDP-alcohol phosphatidyltransferase family protein n=1 Tax=Microbacterium sp. NPDC056569 TaxID=3345867 RepID=UPI00366FE84B
MERLARGHALAALGSAQKPAVGVPAYLRWVNRPLGGRVAVEAAVVGATPNQLTAVSAALGAGGVLLIALGSGPWAPPLAALLLLAGYVFDSADGQLSRIQRRGGPAGEWLDHVVDGVRSPLVHVAVAVYLFRTGASPALIAVAALFSVLVSAWFLSQLLAEKLLPRPARSAEQSPSFADSLIKQPQDPSTTYVIIGLLAVPVAFGIAYSALFVWQLLVFAVSLRRKYRQLRSL